jgi:hypothetical protein
MPLRATLLRMRREAEQRHRDRIQDERVREAMQETLARRELRAQHTVKATPKGNNGRG